MNNVNQRNCFNGYHFEARCISFSMSYYSVGRFHFIEKVFLVFLTHYVVHEVPFKSSVS